jgi:predicted phosphodiesterase
MRCLVLSDVHGNANALRAVLDAVAGDRVEHILCLGDTVGYGPFPNECVETLRDLGAVTVIGNHELLALGWLPADRSGDLARRTTPWTQEALTASVRAYIEALPRHARVGDVLLAHGSPDDPQEYVRGGERARGLLDGLGTARILLLGHTHEPWAFGAGRGTLLRGPRTRLVRLDPTQRHLLNPGSVGQSRDRTLAARFLVLDTERAKADFRAVPYDVPGHVEALLRAGLPPGTHWMRPTARDSARRLVRRVTRARSSRPADRSR